MYGMSKYLILRFEVVLFHDYVDCENKNEKFLFMISWFRKMYISQDIKKSVCKSFASFQIIELHLFSQNGIAVHVQFNGCYNISNLRNQIYSQIKLLPLNSLNTATSYRAWMTGKCHSSLVHVKSRSISYCTYPYIK